MRPEAQGDQQTGQHRAGDDLDTVVHPEKAEGQDQGVEGFRKDEGQRRKLNHHAVGSLLHSFQGCQAILISGW